MGTPNATTNYIRQTIDSLKVQTQQLIRSFTYTKFPQGFDDFLNSSVGHITNIQNGLIQLGAAIDGWAAQFPGCDEKSYNNSAMFEDDWKKIHAYCDGYVKYCLSNPAYTASKWDGGFLPELYPDAPELPPGFMPRDHVNNGMLRRIQMLGFQNLQQMSPGGFMTPQPMPPNMMSPGQSGAPFGDFGPARRTPTPGWNMSVDGPRHAETGMQMHLTRGYMQSLRTRIDVIDNTILRFCEGYASFYRSNRPGPEYPSLSELRHNFLPVDYPNAPELPIGFLANDTIYAGLQRHHAYLAEKQQASKMPIVKLDIEDLGDIAKTNNAQGPGTIHLGEEFGDLTSDPSAEPKPNLLDKSTYEGLGLGYPTQS